MILTCINTTYVSIFSLSSPPLSIHPFPFNHYYDILNVQAHFQDSFCWRWAVFWIFLTDIDRMWVVVCFYWQDRFKEHFQSHKNCNGLYIRLGKVRVSISNRHFAPTFLRNKSARWNVTCFGGAAEISEKLWLKKRLKRAVVLAASHLFWRGCKGELMWWGWLVQVIKNKSMFALMPLHF